MILIYGAHAFRRTDIIDSSHDFTNLIIIIIIYKNKRRTAGIATAGVYNCIIHCNDTICIHIIIILSRERKKAMRQRRHLTRDLFNYYMCR